MSLADKIAKIKSLCQALYGRSARVFRLGSLCCVRIPESPAFISTDEALDLLSCVQMTQQATTGR